MVSSCDGKAEEYHILISGDLFNDYYLHWAFERSHSIVITCLYSVGFWFHLILLDSFRLPLHSYLCDTFHSIKHLSHLFRKTCFQFHFLFTNYAWHTFRMIVKFYYSSMPFVLYFIGLDRTVFFWKIFTIHQSLETSKLTKFENPLEMKIKRAAKITKNGQRTIWRKSINV